MCFFIGAIQQSLGVDGYKRNVRMEGKNETMVIRRSKVNGITQFY